MLVLIIVPELVWGCAMIPSLVMSHLAVYTNQSALLILPVAFNSRVLTFEWWSGTTRQVPRIDLSIYPQPLLKTSIWTTRIPYIPS